MDITLVEGEQLVDSLIRDVPVQQQRHDAPRPYESWSFDRDARTEMHGGGAGPRMPTR